MWRNLLIFLSVLGPSVITTMAGNDGAGVITYSFAGAQLGYAVLFTLPILTLFYGITQEMGSRIAIVTEKGLGDIIRERFGIRTALFIFVTILIANFGTLMTNIAALKTAGEMLRIPTQPFIIVLIVVSFIIVTLTEYEKSQKIFLTGIIFYFAYVFSAVKVSPDWGRALASLFVPSSSMFTREYLVISMAILGTTITPWGQFFVQSYMKDKKVPVSKLGFAKLEAYIGAVISNFFTFFIMLATAATLFVNNIPLDSGEKAAMAIRPFAGEFAGFLFAIGLANAAVIGIIIISLTSSYAFTEFFGFTGSLDDPYMKGKTFYTIFMITIIAATFLVMTPWFPLFKIVLYTQSLNGILLPIFFFFILRIINNEDIMGEHVNGRWYNIFAIGSTVFIAIAAIATITIGLLNA